MAISISIDRQFELIVYHLVIVSNACQVTETVGTGVNVTELLNIDFAVEPKIAEQWFYVPEFQFIAVCVD